MKTNENPNEVKFMDLTGDEWKKVLETVQDIDSTFVGYNVSGTVLSIVVNTELAMIRGDDIYYQKAGDSLKKLDKHIAEIRYKSSPQNLAESQWLIRILRHRTIRCLKLKRTQTAEKPNDDEGNNNERDNIMNAMEKLWKMHFYPTDEFDRDDKYQSITGLLLMCRSCMHGWYKSIDMDDVDECLTSWIDQADDMINIIMHHVDHALSDFTLPMDRIFIRGLYVLSYYIQKFDKIFNCGSPDDICVEIPDHVTDSISIIMSNLQKNTNNQLIKRIVDLINKAKIIDTFYRFRQDGPHHINAEHIGRNYMLCEEIDRMLNLISKKTPLPEITNWISENILPYLVGRLDNLYYDKYDELTSDDIKLCDLIILLDEISHDYKNAVLYKNRIISLIIIIATLNIIRKSEKNSDFSNIIEQRISKGIAMSIPPSMSISELPDKKDGNFDLIYEIMKL